MALDIEVFHDATTATLSYIVADTATGACAVIDSVLGCDPVTGQLDRSALKRLCSYIGRWQLRLQWILETHPHADHLSGAHELKVAVGGSTGIGSGVVQVQQHWWPLLAPSPQTDWPASAFDRLLADADTLDIGKLRMRVMNTPGHTPACVTYLIEDAAFVGDALMMPGAGTGRCDFPGGSATQLFHSIQRILALPAETRIFCAHNAIAPSAIGRAASSVSAHRDHNVHLRAGITEREFVRRRTSRDKELQPPALLYRAMQINLRAGRVADIAGSGAGVAAGHPRP